MSDLIARLREHDDPRLYQEADVLMSQAADRIAELEAQKPAVVLSQLRATIKGMQEAAYTYGEYSKEAVSIALDGVLEAIDYLDAALEGEQE